MVSANSRLYRVDDQYMLKDLKSGNAYVIYDIDSTQPRLDHLEYVSPDMTRALIASAKTAKTKKTIWANITGGGHLMEYLTVIIVIAALAYGFLMKGI